MDIRRQHNQALSPLRHTVVGRINNISNCIIAKRMHIGAHP